MKEVGVHMEKENSCHQDYSFKVDGKVIATLKLCSGECELHSKMATSVEAERLDEIARVTLDADGVEFALSNTDVNGVFVVEVGVSNGFYESLNVEIIG